MKSMTGFGISKFEQNKRSYSIEIKSVNHRYSDVNIKIPKNISYLEEKIRKEILKEISRGKIDISITFNNNSSQEKQLKVNKELITQYINILKEIANQNKIQSNIEIIELLKFPEILTIQNNDDDEMIAEELYICLKQAIENFVKMRKEEGDTIEKDLEKKIKSISEKVEKISEYSTRLVEEYIVKLEKRIKEVLKVDLIDEQRLADRKSVV